jgi:hypothetical protein
VYAHINANAETFDIDQYMTDLFDMVALQTGSVNRAAMFVQTAFAIINKGRSISTFKTLLDETKYREDAILDMVNRFTDPVEGLERIFIYIGFRPAETLPSTAATGPTTATTTTTTPISAEEEEEEEEKETSLVPGEKIVVSDITYEDFELLPNTSEFAQLRALKQRLDEKFDDLKSKEPSLYRDINNFLKTTIARTIIEQYNTALSTGAVSPSRKKPDNIKLKTTGQEVTSDQSLLYVSSLYQSLKNKLSGLNKTDAGYADLQEDVNNLGAFLKELQSFRNKDVAIVEQEIEKVLNAIAARMQAIETGPDGKPVATSKAYLINEEEYARVSVIVEGILQRYFRTKPFGIVADINTYLNKLNSDLRVDRNLNVREHLEKFIGASTRNKITGAKALKILDEHIASKPDFLEVLADPTTPSNVLIEYFDDFGLLLSERLYDTSRDVGNEFDAGVRDFVADVDTSVKETELLSKEAAEQLEEILKPFREAVGQIASETEILFDEDTKIAGQMDLLFIDENQEWWVVDVKTGKAAKWKKYGLGTDTYKTYIRNALQQIIYKRILQKITGLDKVNLGILPLDVDYDDTTGKINSVKQPSKVKNQALSSEQPFITINENEKFVVFASDSVDDDTKKEMTLSQMVDEIFKERSAFVTEEETEDTEEETEEVPVSTDAKADVKQFNAAKEGALKRIKNSNDPQTIFSEINRLQEVLKNSKSFVLTPEEQTLIDKKLKELKDKGYTFKIKKGEVLREGENVRVGDNQTLLKASDVTEAEKPLIEKELNRRKSLKQELIKNGYSEEEATVEAGLSPENNIELVSQDIKVAVIKNGVQEKSGEVAIRFISVKDAEGITTDTKAEIERRRQEEYAKIDAKYSEQIEAWEKKRKENIERTGLAGDTRALDALKGLVYNAKQEVDKILNKELDELDTIEDKKEDIKNALDYILTGRYNGKDGRKRQSTEVGEKIAQKIATGLSNQGLIKQDGKLFSTLEGDNLGVAWSVGKYFAEEFKNGFDAELAALEGEGATGTGVEADVKEKIKKKIISKLQTFFGERVANAETATETQNALMSIILNISNIINNESQVISLVNELISLSQNQFVDRSFLNKQEQILLGRVFSNLEKAGYEVIEMLGKEYKEGMEVIANFVPSKNPDSDTGKKVITKVIKPQINFKGQKIQAAQIEATVDYDPKYDVGAGSLEEGVEETPTEIELTDKQVKTLNKIERRPRGEYIIAKADFIRELINAGNTLSGKLTYNKQYNSFTLEIPISEKIVKLAVYIDTDKKEQYQDPGDKEFTISLLSESVIEDFGISMVYEDVLNVVDKETGEKIGRVGVTDTSVFKNKQDATNILREKISNATTAEELYLLKNDIVKFLIDYGYDETTDSLTKALDDKLDNLKISPIGEFDFFHKKDETPSINTAYKIVSYNATKKEITVSLVTDPSVKETISTSQFMNTFDPIVDATETPAELTPEETLLLDITDENLQRVIVDPSFFKQEVTEDSKGLEDDLANNAKC